MFHTIITDWIHAVSPPKKKEKDILKNQVFAEIYHDVVASEKTVWFRKFDTGIIVEHKKDQNISMKVMGIDGATISHGPELTGSVNVSPQNLYRNRQSNTIRQPLNWKTNYSSVPRKVLNIKVVEVRLDPKVRFQFLTELNWCAISSLLCYFVLLLYLSF